MIRQAITTMALSAALALGACTSVPPPDSGGYQVQQPYTGAIAGTAYESVCHLNTTRALTMFGVIVPFSRSGWDGSAVLWDGQYLITAGHNVYQDNSSIRQVEVRCGVANARDEAGEPHQVISGDMVLDARGYTGSPFARDFGLIRLDEPISVSQPFRLATTPVLPGEVVTLAGYPGGPYDAKDLFSARGVVTEIDRSLAYYGILTHQSNSGGPVWRETATGPGLVAVHVRGDDQAMVNFAGRMVDPEFRSELTRLRAELDRRAAEAAAE